jgi:hypothetical protein
MAVVGIPSMFSSAAAAFCFSSELAAATGSGAHGWHSTWGSELEASIVLSL